MFNKYFCYLPQKGGSLYALRSHRLGCGFSWWASAVGFVHGSFSFKMLSAEASCLFVKSPHLIQSDRQARLCRKKNLVSAASREDFFRANLKGSVLTRLVDCSEILEQKGSGVILCSHQTLTRNF